LYGHPQVLLSSVVCPVQMFYVLLLSLLLYHLNKSINQSINQSHACWLPVHRDQLRVQRSVTSMRSFFTFLTSLWF